MIVEWGRLLLSLLLGSCLLSGRLLGRLCCFELLEFGLQTGNLLVLHLDLVALGRSVGQTTLPYLQRRLLAPLSVRCQDAGSTNA